MLRVTPRGSLASPPPRPLFLSYYIVFSFMSVLFDVLPFILGVAHPGLVSSCMDNPVAI